MNFFVSYKEYVFVNADNKHSSINCIASLTSSARKIPPINYIGRDNEVN